MSPRRQVDWTIRCDEPAPRRPRVRGVRHPDTWQSQVLAFFDTRAINAAAQSANAKIEDVRRAARGFRNPHNYHARITLHAGQPCTVPTTPGIRSYTVPTAA